MRKPTNAEIDAKEKPSSHSEQFAKPPCKTGSHRYQIWNIITRRGGNSFQLFVFIQRIVLLIARHDNLLIAEMAVILIPCFSHFWNLEKNASSLTLTINIV